MNRKTTVYHYCFLPVLSDPHPCKEAQKSIAEISPRIGLRPRAHPRSAARLLLSLLTSYSIFQHHRSAIQTLSRHCIAPAFTHTAVTLTLILLTDRQELSISAAAAARFLIPFVPFIPYVRMAAAAC